ncbi:hypothetical protein AAFC00_005528 [Neodothiora populina]|uniref:Nuclear architecture-related protein 1 n=1 Tax=Neodothiora populina TaxID=2781224 RepID=A0ABR3PL63_9PEZI
MSAILSADDLNDFISPGVACIKPVETLPKQQPSDSTSNPYEVTTEDKVAAADAPPASISLTDCLACSGCVTSAEAVLVSLQSHAEVLSTLDAYPELPVPSSTQTDLKGQDGKIFIASVSPQTRASIAATYNVSEGQASNMIAQLLSGPRGLRSGGASHSGFTWILDTNTLRDIALVSAADEVAASLSSDPTREEQPKKPVLASACPGWICYAEKTHPHVLPHISRLKSPQALAGTLVKSVLARRFGLRPSQIWHLAVMPCFDKKLEASREELTDMHWDDAVSTPHQQRTGIRDVDCVITARELLMLAEARDISFPLLPRTPLQRSSAYRPRFPDPRLDSFLFPSAAASKARKQTDAAAGTSGGYLHHILHTHLHNLQTTTHPEARIVTKRGRNADVIDYEIVADSRNEEAEVLFRTARYYGFRNIQNLVRRLKPARVSRLPGAAARSAVRKPMGRTAGGAATPAPAMQDYAFIEVMACPGGCTNGGGQIKVGDVASLRLQGVPEAPHNDDNTGAGISSGIENGSPEQKVLPAQKEWLGFVDEAYFSASSSLDDDEDEDDASSPADTPMTNGDSTAAKAETIINSISHTQISHVVSHWSELTSIDAEKLIFTSYRRVDSDVGDQNGQQAEDFVSQDSVVGEKSRRPKKKAISDVERVAGLANSIGGGW